MCTMSLSLGGTVTYIYIQKKIDNYKIMFYNINNEVNNKKIYYILFYYIIKLFSKRKKNILPLAAFS